MTRDPYQDLFAEDGKRLLARWEECTRAFLSRYPVAKSQSHALPARPGETNSRKQRGHEGNHRYAIESFYIPARGKKVHLVILSSGIHGIEGYAGSAFQLHLLREILPRLLPEDGIDQEARESNRDTGFLLLQNCNPWGTLHKRRVTENNVDLNRNFFRKGEFEGHMTPNPGYVRLRSLLNPASGNPTGAPVSAGWRTRLPFAASVTRELLRTPLPLLRQAIVQGQSEDPAGLFFSGRKREPNVEILESLLLKYGKSYKKVLILDLHTGYGKRGELSLFPNSTTDPELKRNTERIFAGYPVHWPDGNRFYSARGDFSVFAANLFGDTECIPMVLEFGTSGNDTLPGSIRNLRTLIMENQGFLAGYRSEEAKTRISQLFKEAFYPDDPGWRTDYITKHERLFLLALRNFCSPSGI